MTNLEIYRKRNSALIFISATPLLAAGPFLIGLIGASLTPGCNESNCAWGVLPWFSFLTTPVAFVLFIFGLVKFLISLGTRLTKTESVTLEEQKLKGYYRAWMATASGPLLLVIVLLLTIFGGPVNVCEVNDVCTQTGSGKFIETALIVAAAFIALSWLYVTGLWIRNKMNI